MRSTGTTEHGAPLRAAYVALVLALPFWVVLTVFFSRLAGFTLGTVGG